MTGSILLKIKERAWGDMALVSPGIYFLNGKIPFHVDKWATGSIYTFNYKINPVKVIIG